MFTPPEKDIQFCLFELFRFAEHYGHYAPDLDQELVASLVTEYSRFCSDFIEPLTQSGDEEGCRLENGQVITPKGFKEAYKQYCDAGWPSLSRSSEFGGQGLPQSLGFVMNELSATANYAWNMYLGLSQGAMSTIEHHGSEEQKALYLPRLISGEWTGTMCLTESHCGTDLGLMKTKAIPLDDGNYAIQGTKIFISSGDHDLTENIVHIVLARLPDAPAGTKGLSLFIVPKYRVKPDGSIAEHNHVTCGGLEHKMGIHANATCVLNFDGAQGTLLGEPHKGLQVMFTFMNLARLGTGLQGLAHAEWGYQRSLAYARERLQGRALTGVAAPDKAADPIIVHPDVRRMLLTQKALTEGMRMLAYFAVKRVDIAQLALEPEKRQAAQDLLSILTPIAKGFMTETGFESANLALQCFGGHGYIREWGMERNLRDCRIASLYEGTTGVQALDLLGRKILMTKGELLLSLTRCIQEFCEDSAEIVELAPYLERLATLRNEWLSLTQSLGVKAAKDPNEVGAASVDYLMYSGYILLGFFWVRAAKIAHQALLENRGDMNFYQSKWETAKFYFDRILPRVYMHEAAIKSGAGSTMLMTPEQFSANY